MSKQEIVSAFVPVINQPIINLTPVSEEDIVDLLIVDSYDSDDEGNVIPKQKQIEAKRYNRKEYIESFSDEVGLKNILEKVGIGAIAEDKYSILKTNALHEVTDLTPLGDIKNYGDIVALAEKATNTWNNLDPDLKKNMNLEQFVSSFNDAELLAYVKGKLPKPEGGNE